MLSWRVIFPQPRLYLIIRRVKPVKLDDAPYELRREDMGEFRDENCVDGVAARALVILEAVPTKAARREYFCKVRIRVCWDGVKGGAGSEEDGVEARVHPGFVEGSQGGLTHGVW